MKKSSKESVKESNIVPMLTQINDRMSSCELMWLWLCMADLVIKFMTIRSFHQFFLQFLLLVFISWPHGAKVPFSLSQTPNFRVEEQKKKPQGQKFPIRSDICLITSMCLTHTSTLKLAESWENKIFVDNSVRRFLKRLVLIFKVQHNVSRRTF